MSGTENEYKRAQDILNGFNPTSFVDGSFCAQCQEPIIDGEFLSLADGQQFHVNCFNCDHCKKSLGTSFLSRDGKRYHQNCYRDHLAPQCRQCGQPLDGTQPVAVLVDGSKFHKGCLKCALCKLPLGEKFSQQEGKLYHKECYSEMFAPKCKGCNGGIMMQAQYVEVKGATFHVECFKCFNCKKPITTAGFTVPKENTYLCSACSRAGAGVALLAPKSNEQSDMNGSIKSKGLNQTLSNDNLKNSTENLAKKTGIAAPTNSHNALNTSFNAGSQSQTSKTTLNNDTKGSITQNSLKTSQSKLPFTQSPDTPQSSLATSSSTDQLMSRLNQQLQILDNKTEESLDSKLKNTNLPPASKAVVDFHQKRQQDAPMGLTKNGTLTKSQGSLMSQYDSAAESLHSNPTSAMSSVGVQRARTTEAPALVSNLAIAPPEKLVPPPPAPITAPVSSGTLRTKTSKALSPLSHHKFGISSSENPETSALGEAHFSNSAENSGSMLPPPPPPPPPLSSFSEPPTRLIPRGDISSAHSSRPTTAGSRAGSEMNDDSRRNLMDEIRQNPKSHLRKVDTLKKKDTSMPGFLRPSSGGSNNNLSMSVRSSERLSSIEQSPNTPQFARELMTALAQKRIAVSLDDEPDDPQKDDEGSDWDD